MATHHMIYREIIDTIVPSDVVRFSDFFEFLECYGISIILLYICRSCLCHRVWQVLGDIQITIVRECAHLGAI